MQKIKLDIIHFHAVELYPPVLNFINCIEKSKDIDFRVLTTNNIASPFTFKIDDTRIQRLYTTGPKNASTLIRFIYFNVYTLISLIQRSPDTILYYETISSWPAIFYKRYIRKRVIIMVHYHELVREEQLKKESRVIRFFRPLEKNLFPSYEWISHTNQIRADLFYLDYPNYINKDTLKILPNYPPASWIINRKPRRNKDCFYPLKTVLVGSISYNSMYLKEYCQWIMNQDGKLTFDIYSFNYDAETVNYISSLGTKLLSLKPSVPYFKIPKILKHYDIGVMLYKAKEDNEKYCASNKLFEYHTCGLDVWFPKEQVGSLEYERKDDYPKIIGLDFTNLNEISIEQIVSMNNMQNNQKQFTSEKVYFELIKQISSKATYEV